MKKSLMLLIIIIVLVISGCQNSVTNPNQLQGRSLTGTQALQMNFVRDMPPSHIYVTDSSYINVGVELKNKGGYPLGGFLVLSGYDPNLLTGINNQESISLEPATPYLDGGYQMITFTSPYINLRDITRPINQPLTVTACFDYETKADVPICVDPNPTAVVQNKPCVVKSTGVSGGQGAPVAVTGVDVSMAGSKAILKISVSNSGGGTVLRSSYECPIGLNFEDIGVIRYDVILSGLVADCQPRSELRLNGNSGLIACTADVSGDTAFVTPLRINLYYGYMQSISTNIQLERSP